jgi:hypothetical protein
MRPLKRRLIDKVQSLDKTLEAVVKGLGLVAVIVAQVIALYHTFPR